MLPCPANLRERRSLLSPHSHCPAANENAVSALAHTRSPRAATAAASNLRSHPRRIQVHFQGGGRATNLAPKPGRWPASLPALARAPLSSPGRRGSAACEYEWISWPQRARPVNRGCALAGAYLAGGRAVGFPALSFALSLRSPARRALAGGHWRRRLRARSSEPAVRRDDTGAHSLLIRISSLNL